MDYSKAMEQYDREKLKYGVYTMTDSVRRQTAVKRNEAIRQPECFVLHNDGINKINP
jgi:hypothetical protein